MKNDPEVWGPYYWFFLHSIAYNYPENPNEVTKKKYYDLIQNMPLFLPVSKIGNQFAELLDKYPVTPYLSSQKSFVKWMHFIHNKINLKLGKIEITYLESLDNYESKFKPKPIYLSEILHFNKTYLHLIIILLCVVLIYLLQ
jgi:FAD-linked sulfhydryl oxidase